MRTFATYTLFAALLAAGITVAVGAAHAGGWGDQEDRLAQVAELEQLHATFHGAVSVHDPVNGDSPTVITQRIRDILAIYAEEGEITIVNSTAAAGNYIGNGDPDDLATCPPPSGDTSATGKQGTLCTLYKYVAPAFQPANKFVSLSPAYKTKFVPVWTDGWRGVERGSPLPIVSNPNCGACSGFLYASPCKRRIR